MCVLGATEWCSKGDPCFACEDAAHRELHPVPVADCRTCKMRSVILSHDATPSRPWRPQTRLAGGNEWERGVPTDSRGMPWLRPGTVAPVGVKEFSEKRHQIQSARRQLANA